MPTYDYSCDACGHRLERYQAITATPLRRCPACKRRSLRRLLGSGGGIIFKGSGFHQTDYRSESYKKGAETEKKATGTGDGKNSATQPAAQTDHAKKPAKSACSPDKTD